MTPASSPRIKGNPRDFLVAGFFGALYFLSSSDLFFAFRIHGLNFRLGQLLLLAAALPVVGDFLSDPRGQWNQKDSGWPIFRFWVPFFAAYALATLFSENPGNTTLKLVWALFNIGGALLVVLSPRFNDALARGFYFGIAAIALSIWAQFLGLYWFRDLIHLSSFTPGEPMKIGLGGLFLGYTQPAGQFNDTSIYRPHAFFYEPSYAGCALAFAFPVWVAWGRGNNRWTGFLVPALILGAVFMTSSRSAILGVTLALLALLIGGLILSQKSLVKKTLKIILVGVLLLLGLCVAQGPRDYFGFLLGPLGPKAVVSRLPDEDSSEGWRLQNVINSLRLWGERPLLGRGVIPSPSNGKVLHGMGQSSESMWLEIGVESGLVGFLAFAYALFRTIRSAAGACGDEDLLILVAAGLAVHLVVSMNFTSTFPRLDYWLLFFLAMRLWVRSPGETRRTQ